MATVICVRKANLVKLGYKDFEDWLKNPQNVYVGRRVVYVKGTFDSDWRNTFSAKKFGRSGCCEMFVENMLNVYCVQVAGYDNAVLPERMDWQRDCVREADL